MAWEEIFPWLWATFGWAFALWSGAQTKKMAKLAKHATEGWRRSVEREKALMRTIMDEGGKD